MGSKKDELFGIDGLWHALYALISYVAVYFIHMKIAIIICFAVNTIVWFYIEYSQEKAMVKDGKRGDNDDSLKPWKWSKARTVDWGYPMIVGIIFLIIT